MHAATAFYDHLRRLPDGQNVSVTRAAQDVQHSATPDAYARWESHPASSPVPSPVNDRTR